MKQLRILVACEESQEVCKAFRALGHKAFSCDLQECSGGHPEWHIKGDALKVLNLPIWDLVIAHPPCTYLCVSGNRWFNVEKYGQKAIQRGVDREEAVKFFMNFANCNCKYIAIENPIGIISSVWRQPTQIIQPFEFGHPYTKSTCLWLKNLPKLKPTKILDKPANGWDNQSFTKDGKYSGFNGKFSGAKRRSKTFPGIAKAMAEQWSKYILIGDKNGNNRNGVTK